MLNWHSFKDAISAIGRSVGKQDLSECIHVYVGERERKI